MTDDVSRLDGDRYNDMTLIDMLMKLLEGSNLTEGLWRSYQSQSLSQDGTSEHRDREYRAYIAGAVGLWFILDKVITSNQVSSEQRDNLLKSMRDHMSATESNLADLLQSSLPTH